MSEFCRINQKHICRLSGLVATVILLLAAQISSLPVFADSRGGSAIALEPACSLNVQPLIGEIQPQAQLDEVIITAGIFEPKEARKLADKGLIIIGTPGSNYFHLVKGNVRFKPKSDIIVGTSQASVCIAGGANVLVINNAQGAAIYNCGQACLGEVSVFSDYKELVLQPGCMIALNDQDADDLASCSEGAGTLAMLSGQR